MDEQCFLIRKIIYRNTDCCPTVKIIVHQLVQTVLQLSSYRLRRNSCCKYEKADQPYRSRYLLGFERIRQMNKNKSVTKINCLEYEAFLPRKNTSFQLRNKNKICASTFLF